MTASDWLPILIGLWLVCIAFVLDNSAGDAPWLDKRGCGFVDHMFVEDCR